MSTKDSHIQCKTVIYLPKYVVHETPGSNKTNRTETLGRDNDELSRTEGNNKSFSGKIFIWF